MSYAVLADAQYSVARPYRPFRGFEEVYQGQPTSVPIAIPGILDRDAGKTGFDSNLLAGIPIPYGSKMTLWIPTVFNEVGIQSPLPVPYRYSVIWRMRNLRDFRVRRSAYHLPLQSFGENNQFVIPAAAEGLMFEAAPMSEPVQPQAPNVFTTKRSAVHEFSREEVVFDSFVPTAPLTPTGAVAAYQQGLSDVNGAVGSNTTVTFNQIQLDALGDEFMILVSRGELTGSSNWDFGTQTLDAGFSRFFGTNNGAREPLSALGIYVMTGSNP